MIVLFQDVSVQRIADQLSDRVLVVPQVVYLTVILILTSVKKMSNLQLPQDVGALKEDRRNHLFHALLVCDAEDRQPEVVKQSESAS
mgnify:CR=1 FL=1